MKSHILASTMYIDIVASNEVFISFVQASWVQFQSKVVHYFELKDWTFHALERAIRTCTRTHNQQMYACTQIGQSEPAAAGSI